MKKLKTVLSLMLALCLVLALAACGGAASSTAGSASKPAASTAGSEPAPAGDARSLVISLERAQPEVEEQRVKYFNDPLQAAFPNDNITIDVFADVQSLQVQVAGGSGPDVFHLNGPTDATEYAKAERIIDLTAYADQYGWEDLFYDWAWGTSFYNGKLYSLPNSFEGMVIYYNDDVFTDNGWEKPTNIDELLAILQDAQSKGIIPMAFGNSNYQGAVDWLYSTFLSCYPGPEVLKAALEGETTFKDPLIVEGMQLLVDWWQAGYIGDKKSQAITTDDMVALFANGEAAMMIDGSWAATSLMNTYPDSNWDVAVVPEMRAGVGEVTPLATGGCYSVNATCKDPDFAAEVLNWIFVDSLDVHLQSVVEAGFQPYPLKAITADDLSAMDPKMVDVYDVLFDGMSTGIVGYCSWTFYPSDARVYMNENTDALFLGTLTVDAYMTEVQAYVDNAIETGTSPTLP